LPYYFETTTVELKQSAKALTYWRGITFNNGDINYYYTFGDMKFGKDVG